MNIIKEQNDNLSAQIKISIDEPDYQDRVKKELNKLRGKAQMPGFRQGHVPFSLIQKMYGHAVLLDEINKILQESIEKFLKEEKINLLGSPFPAADSPMLDFENDKQFDFTFNVILAPEINLDFLKTLPTTYYKIIATDDIIDEQIDALRHRFGTSEEVFDSVKVHDYLYCNCQSLENKDIQSQTYFFVDEKINPWATSFIKHNVNETVEIDIDKFFDGDVEKASKTLNLPEENKSHATGLFAFTIKKINRRKQAELNEDFYKKSYPDKDITTEKELRTAIAEAHSEMCDETVRAWFFNNTFDPIIEAANLQYDDAMLRQYMYHQKQSKHEKQKQTEEASPVSDEEFERVKKGTSWQLIQQKLADTYKITVEQDEIKQAAKEQISRYFGINLRQAELQLGEYMTNMVDNVLKDENQVQDLYIRVMDEKITEILKENTKITIKEITWDEFREAIETKALPAPTAQMKTRRSTASKKKTDSSEEITFPEETKPKEKACKGEKVD